MLQIRRSADRGHADHGWLDTHHSFSFGTYYDPEHMGFRTLRVLNEDRVDAGAGFPTHPHSNMEIISYVISGSLAHKDSMGNVETIGPGEIQAMTAGTGITHSEYNPSDDEPVHFLQIWLKPAQNNLTPRYAQKLFTKESRRNRLALVVSPDAASGSLKINQDARFYASLLEAGKIAEHTFAAGRAGWLQLITGELRVGNESLLSGDGLRIENSELVPIEAILESEFVLLDLG